MRNVVLRGVHGRFEPPKYNSHPSSFWKLLMDIKIFVAVFGTVFLAELGDKTQLATTLFASREPSSLLTIFAAASLALIVSTGLAVAVGSTVSNYIDPKYLSYAAGTGFIVIGIWTIWQA
jgi:putative Ca2+/H+ antiporter (TMEM165/GDT1 family)